MSELIRLVYASRASFEPADAAAGIDPTVARILLQSRRNNSQLKIGGVLYYGNGCFFQCLEGPRDLVEPLADEIRQDPRHRDFRILRKQAVDARLFSGWSMKFVALESNVDELLRRFELDEFDPYLFDDAIIDELTRLFAAARPIDAGADADPARPATRRESGLLGWLRKLFG